MKRTGLVLGLTALGLLGLALTQGMMGGYGPGYGMMGPGMMGMGMGGMGMMAVYPPEAKPIPEEVAKARMEAYAKRLYPGARLKDFMAFSQNYYVQVVDERGQGLFELIADRYTGVVSPEPGPNMIEEGAFPGYYTFDFGRKEVEGMLSVNAYTGEVWVHTWHGPFLGGHEE